MRKLTLILALCALLLQTNFLTAKTVAPVKTPATLALETINRSVQDNKLLGISDSSKIQVNDRLVFRLDNGKIIRWTVVKGENQYNILVKIFKDNPNNFVVADGIETSGRYPALTDPISDTNQAGFAFLLPYLAANASWLWMPLFLLVAFLAWGAYTLYKKSQAKKAAKAEKHRIANSPTEAGPPVVAGGITDNNVQEVMTHATRVVHNTTLPIHIISMEKGTINATNATVYFNGRVTKDGMAVNNVRGVRALVTIGDETEQRIVYALEACGNPLRRGEFVIGNGIEFTPDPVGANIPVAVPAPAEVEQIANNAETKVTDVMYSLPEVVRELQTCNEGKVTITDGVTTITVEVKNQAVFALMPHKHNGEQVVEHKSDRN